MRHIAVCAMLAAAALGQTTGGGVLVNGDGSFGLRLFVEPTLKEWEFGETGSARIGHSLDAVFGSKLESLPNHLFADLSATYERLGCPAPNFVFDASLRGARLEATQDFRRVDVAAAADVSLYFSSAFAWVYRQLRSDSEGPLRTAAPLSLSLGYSRLFDVSRRDSLGPDWDSRIDAGLFAAIPVKNNLILSCRARVFTLPANAFRPAGWQYFVEPVVTYCWGDKWVHVKYEKGGLPPRYEPTSNWSVGAGFAFD